MIRAPSSSLGSTYDIKHDRNTTGIVVLVDVKELPRLGLRRQSQQCRVGYAAGNSRQLSGRHKVPGQDTM